MPPTFRRFFEGPDEIDYAPDPMGRVGAGMQEIHDPTDDPRGNELFQDFREAWAEGHDLPDLFGRDGMLDIKEPVGPAARNRRPDVAKIETFLDALGEHDAARTEGPTGFYGIGFEDNLKAYQARNGLTPDGLVNPDGETIGRIKQDLTATLGQDRLDRPTSAVAPRGVGSLASPGGQAPLHDKEPPPPLPARITPVAASGDGNERKLTPAPVARRKTNPLIIDYENTWLAAQQRTSPHVIGPDGTLNYQRASEAWQRYYKRYGEVYQDVFVILIDPRNGEPTVWLRNPEMRESGLLGIARVFTWLALPGKLTNAPKVAQAARVGAKPALIQRARVDIAKFLRLAHEPLKATSPEQFFGSRIWNSLSPSMKALIRPRFSYFVGTGAEIRGGKTLDTAGFTVTHNREELKFFLKFDGKQTSRIFDRLTDEEIISSLFRWFAKPEKPTGLPAGIEIKFASSPVLKSQTAKDEALRKAGEIVAAHIMRIPAHRVKRADVAEAINIWLKNNKGSSVLTDRQEQAFKILVTQLQRKRLPDGTALTVGQLFGLSLLLALKVQNQPLIPPPPVEVPRPLFDPDEA